MSRRPPGAPSRAWLILPVLCAGIFFACVAALVSAPRERLSAADVRTELQQIALRRSDNPKRDDGGPIGPWWVAAGDIDPSTGMLVKFRLTSGPMEIAARRARLVVDASTDSFRFELYEVVLTRVPADGEDLPDHHLVRFDEYTLGPVPYGRAIAE